MDSQNSMASDTPEAGGVLTPVARVLPKPGTEEVSKALDAMLAEYDFPANTKNAARAGWEAANRWLVTRPTPAAAADLHQQIANLPATAPASFTSEARAGYMIGHGDARHAAAELVAASPAAADLHQQIMNLPCKDAESWTPQFSSGYYVGHRDARLAAAELVAASPAAAAEGVGGPTFYVRHPDDSYSVADPQPLASPVAPAGAPTEAECVRIAEEAGMLGDVRLNAPSLQRFAMALLSAGSQAEGAHQDASVNEAAPQTNLASPSPLPSPRAPGRSELPQMPKEQK